MSTTEPSTALDPRFSSDGAEPVPWTRARRELAEAETYWLSTVRPDGRPHVTTLLAVWRDGALHFCTGPDERKARNLAQNPQCVLTTGCNRFDRGLDLVVEGRAEPVTDEAVLRPLAEAYEAKYGPDWHFDVRDGAFRHGGGDRRVSVRAGELSDADEGKGWLFYTTPSPRNGPLTRMPSSA
ncbi:pyridoxamine 5'-phosphate oxidase family protein [Streptomyces armeniacus]|uniref:Pyridoxamine 5'-phosphate oxidase family protein n=1 Tax=Streptomyces armeniacus TaxID=83291 RepID=A0A345XNU3_9ACTN|nr:pyridoxamine 5'-phosphate oxidase family protein [Streptomyces armeniacus]AXK33309.1 pyridoxamine 5'-phosphate oxidase family protein [Streptomyces armeniacus]